MVRKVRESDDNHYFYVMGWTDRGKKTAPIKKKKFNIYDNAVDYYDELTKSCGFVQMFEVIGGKRKWIMDTEDSHSQLPRPTAKA